DEELEEIKRRKMLEYQRLLEAKRLEEERRRAELERERMLRALLTPEARRRLSNLKLVRPELVETIEVQLIQLVQAGRLKPPITDRTLKIILAEIARRSRRNIRIKFRGLR
ncbi:MAG: DNA-binding protein, partial [Thermoprotei archaeon]